jgi:CheY-like chemotaxis protein
MKVVLCPNSSETEGLIRKAVAPLGLTLECSTDVRYVTDMIAAADCPVLAILSMNISGISGMSVCEELTAAETARPISVLLLGTDNNVKTVAGAYASGADDYVVLPCDLAVLVARIGAAARRLVRFEHMPGFDKNSSSNRQKTSAVPILTRPTAPPPQAPEASPKRSAENTFADQFLAIPTLRDAKAHTLNGFKALHVPNVVELEAVAFVGGEPTMGAWSALLLPNQNLWLDVVVETDRQSADFLYRHLSGVKPVTSEDSASAMIQLVKTLKEQLQVSFQAAGEEVILPILPRRVPASELGGLSRFVVDRMRLAVGSPQIQVCVSYFASERASIYKKIEQLRSRDITDEMIPLPDSHHPLLNRGVMLDERKLNLLRNRFLNHESDVGIRVFEPSSVSSVIQYV